MSSLSLGFSPCPNDTFIFHGLVHGKTETDLSFKEPYLEDVETLNNWALQGVLDVTKLSFHAVGHVLEEYCILKSGGALGRGCGPILIAKSFLDLKQGSQLKIAIPGKYTTAAMLFKIFAPQCAQLIEMRFDEIMPSIDSGHVDGGVIIHESRFTYEQEGLVCIQDLGQWWEDTTGYPIPLGCIAAKRSLGQQQIEKIDKAIRGSLEYANSKPTESLEYIRYHSQELEEQVIQQHIDLYVNSYSVVLGEDGEQSVQEFLRRGQELGFFPALDKPFYSV